MKRADWEFVFNQNCVVEWDEDLGAYWQAPGQVHVYIRDLMRAVKGDKFFAEDTCLIRAGLDGKAVRRAYIPWSSIAYIEFVDRERD